MHHFATNVGARILVSLSYNFLKGKNFQILIVSEGTVEVYDWHALVVGMQIDSPPWEKNLAIIQER